MVGILWAILVVGLGAGGCLVLFLGRGGSRGWRFVLCGGVGAGVLAGVFLIPAGYAVLRGLAGVTVVLFLMKGWDVCLQAGRYARWRVRDFAVLLMNHCARPPYRRRRTAAGTPGERARGLAVRTVRLAAVVLAMAAIWRVDWGGYGFWAEHAAKAGVSFFFIREAFTWYCALWALMGYETLGYAAELGRAYTPALFWQRYDRPVHGWLERDVFRPARRGLGTAGAMMLAFGVSGLLHEYVVAAAAGYATGAMVAFFVLQGAASAATWRLRPRGAWRAVGLAGTYGLLFVSSVWFFGAVDTAVGFYMNRLPGWVRWW